MNDLGAMQSLAQRIWSPRSRWHIGDLAWGHFAIPGSADSSRTATWSDDDQTVAWGWLELPGHLELMVDPAHPSLVRDVLTWSDTLTTSEERTVMVLETEDHLISAVEAAGYAPDPAAPFFLHHHMGLETVTPPDLPDGFTLRHVRPDEAEHRAAAHRAAWSDLGPSSVSTASFADVMTAWPYRCELDWVVENPDGQMVASALGWLDEVNGVGLLEPVGCAPGYRRMGLARAVNLATLQAFRDIGARRAVVCPRGDDGYPIPGRLYRGIGFKPGARTRTYVRWSHA